MNSRINFKNLLKNLDYRYPSLINFRDEIEKASWLAKYNAYGDRRNRVIFSPHLINNDINEVSQLTLLAELNESYNFGSFQFLYWDKDRDYDDPINEDMYVFNNRIYTNPFTIEEYGIDKIKDILVRVYTPNDAYTRDHSYSIENNILNWKI